MSRSKRKNPIRGVTAEESDKDFKQREHRRERKAVNSKLAVSSDGDDLPGSKLYGDPWKGNKDGKQYLPNGDRKDLQK